MFKYFLLLYSYIMRTIKDLKKMAELKGFILNPDIKVVKNILRVQNFNKERKGEYYCPCKPYQIPENICNPCKGAENEVKYSGKCHCNLFIRK
jgi:ferredoxin-thioredoxin reductase catalytic subunit